MEIRLHLAFIFFICIKKLNDKLEPLFIFIFIVQDQSISYFQDESASPEVYSCQSIAGQARVPAHCRGGLGSVGATAA